MYASARALFIAKHIFACSKKHLEKGKNKHAAIYKLLRDAQHTT